VILARLLRDELDDLEGATRAMRQAAKHGAARVDDELAMLESLVGGATEVSPPPESAVPPPSSTSPATQIGGLVDETARAEAPGPVAAQSSSAPEPVSARTTPAPPLAAAAETVPESEELVTWADAPRDLGTQELARRLVDGIVQVAEELAARVDAPEVPR